MTIQCDCTQAESIAGAIAIGEANEAQRDAYRAHLSVCRRCLEELGGEREIERVMGGVARARAGECWEPDLRISFAPKRKPYRALGWGAAIAAAAVLIVGIRSAEALRQPVPEHHVISAQEARALAALDTQTMPRREGRAESLAVGTTTLSTAFEVSFDEKGAPVRCTITKSSGDRALDQSICRAALQQHYSPAPIKGR